MIQRFEDLTTGVTRIYKSIQKIKKSRMNALGLKGTHVMCLYYLSRNPEGLTAADLCDHCREDKAGISRILSDLEKQGFLCYDFSDEKKKYRAKAVLTEKGKLCARQVETQILHAVEAGGKGLTEEERQIFYKVLFKIADNLEQSCAQP